MASTARLDELKKKFEENPRRYFAPLANEHRKQGDLDQAIAICRTHLPQQPAHISGHIVLAQALFEAGSLDESREIFHNALGLDPENLIALRCLGDIARDADDVDTARTWYQRVLEVDPRNDEIVQLVRELDMPRVRAPEPEPEIVAEEVAVPAANAAAPEAPVAPAEDPRFAPLSIDQIDIDPVASTETSEATAEPVAAEGPSFDVHAAWNADSPTVELPLLDTQEIDPFDLHPTASADSLFDANIDTSSADIFMAELSAANADPMDADAFSSADAWTPEAEVETVAEAAAAPDASSFEEGAFYLEPAPAAPNEPDAVDATASVEAPIEVTAAAPEFSVESEDAQRQAGVPNEYITGSYEAIEDPAESAQPELTVASAQAFDVPAEADRSADALALFADSQTAEWSPETGEPAAPSEPVSSTQDLGLEVMEFVPPSASDALPYMDAMSDYAAAPESDPLLGRTPELETTNQATPSAFVTETMAELYLQQGFKTEALAVYRELASRSPNDASLRDRIEQIESGLMSSLGMATLSENIVESALKRQNAKPERSVRSFFASLAGRRAPYPTQQPTESIEAYAETSAEVDAVEAAPYDTPVADVEMPAIEAEADADAPVMYAPLMYDPTPVAERANEAPAPESTRIMPMMSAAETLANFDPFADTQEPPASNGMLEVPPNVETIAPQAAQLSSASRSLEDLFPDTPVTARTEAAAETLATAFGRQEPQGRPTRAASSELSLDRVFRGAPESSAPQSDGGFSFDQFFSDSRPASDVATASPEMGRSGGGDGNDIEQFTAWLEGLKKK